MPSSAAITRMYRFSGRVQGVGFRWTTRGIAASFSVSGYVKNLSDGRVEMVAQGQEAVVTEFANAVTARFEHNIDGTECLEDHPEEKLTGFVIRR